MYIFLTEDVKDNVAAVRKETWKELLQLEQNHELD